MIVKTFYAYNQLRNYSYLFIDEAQNNCWIIDPYEALDIINYIKSQGLKVQGIFNTHQHFDHTRGNDLLIKKFECGVLKLSDKDIVCEFSGYRLEVLDTPGHTMDHQVLILKQAHLVKAVFSGDTLFNAGVGNCKNGGDPKILYQSINQLKNLLQPDTLLYPGHDYRFKNLQFSLFVEPENQFSRESLKNISPNSSHLEEPIRWSEELKLNPFLRLSSEELIQNLNSSFAGSEKMLEESQLFYALRTLRDNF